MELTWYGRTCVRLRGKDAVVVSDPFQSVVGPTGRGITGDIVTFSHPDDRPLPRGKGKQSRDGRTLLPSSLDTAFVLDGPGEYEVKEVLVTGVRTYRDDARGAESGKQVAFAVEIDGIHVIHLGDVGHLLSEEKLGDIGSVDIVCVPLGGSLTPARAAELVVDHVVVFGERHLRHVLICYMEYYNVARTHLSLGKDTPMHRTVQAVGRIQAQPVLGGLHHQYARI